MRLRMKKNYEKQERYALLKAKLSRALKNGFWFEALMIEYAIAEDRTSSILFYANVSDNAYSHSKKLSNKLNSIEYQIEKKHPIISKKVSLSLINDIKKWKDSRNELVHRACNYYDEESAQVIATEGAILVKNLSNDSAKVTRASKATEDK